MMRSDKIKSELFGGVGFRQSFDPDYAIVDGDNQLSDSGLYFQDASNFVTIKNIKEAQQVVNISDVDFNTYLKRLQENSIVEVCRNITANESDHLQSVNLYPYEKSFNNSIANNGKFVGFIFEPRHPVNILGKINFIEVAFDSDVDFNIYLYNSNLPETPLQTIPVSAKSNESVVINTDLYLADDINYKGGSFYLGYFQDDIGTAKAIKKDYNLAQLQVPTKCYYVRPVSLIHTSTRIDVDSLINESDVFGLNAGLEVYSDYTELLIRNKNLLWGIIQLQMAEKVLNIIRTSTRSVKNTRELESQINAVAFELYGNESKKIDGIVTKLGRQTNDVKKMLFRRSVISRGTLR